MNVTEKVDRYIKKYNLLTPKSTVLVGFSGGADSVALLVLLVKLGYRCVAMHCNFHLRGEESLRDENFARSFADKMKVPFYKVDFETEKYATENQLSVEMAARALRYEWFESVRRKNPKALIAVAHHQDDNVETFFLNLMRGTGLRGLCGMRPKNQFVIRPLLCLSKKEILDWLKEQQLDFVVDSTNLSDIYLRNNIRLNIIPMFEVSNPSFKQSVAKTMEHLSNIEVFFQKEVESIQKEILIDGCIDILKLQQQSMSETILFEILKGYGFNSSQIEEVYHSLNAISGKQFFSSTHRLLKDRNFLILKELREENTDTERYLIENVKDFDSIPVQIEYNLLENRENIEFDKRKVCVYIDNDAISYPLELRRWKKGDWFIPFGMRGRKKLSDYFSDKKFSIYEKEQSWVLCSGENIVWLVGERLDNRYAVSKKTKTILNLKIR